MRLGAFVMTYHRPSILAETLACLLSQEGAPDFILVVDNGGQEAVREICSRFSAERVAYHPMPHNAGPAGAAAVGLSRLAKAGYDWIYWGDDDDPPRTSDTLARLRVLMAEAPPHVGAVGAVGARWDWQRGRFERLPDHALHGRLEVDTIAGGSQLVVRRAAVEQAGLPDAQLFFGFEEPFYCLCLRRAGFDLWVDGELMRTYRTLAGRLNLQANPAWRPRDTEETLWRRYYSTRNYIYAMRATFDRPDLARSEAVRALLRCGSALLRGPRYGWRFSRLQLRGVMDGYRARLGQTVEPVAKW